MNLNLSCLPLCLIAGLFTANTSARAEDLGLVTAQVRAATGIGERLVGTQSLLLNGYARFSGIQERYSLQLTPSGLFRETYRGPLSQTTGYDGRTVWRLDFMGMPRTLEMQDRETALLVAGVVTEGWLVKEGIYRASLLPKQPEAGLVLLSLRLKQGLLPATLAVDRRTWLPRRLTYTTSEGPQEWLFGHYGPAGARRMAHQWSHSGGGITDTVQILSQQAPVTHSNTYAPMTRTPKDTTFNVRVPSRVPLLRLSSDHLLVRPCIDGRDIGWFILDSGAEVMVLDPVVSASLRMKTFGRQASSGAGALVQTSYCRGRTFALGPFTLRSPLYALYDLRFATKAFHVPIAGVCGYDLFSRAVLEIDRSRTHLSLRDPRGYHLAEGRWQSLFINNGAACIRCRFEGKRTGIFSLDTGSSGTVDFLAPAVNNLGLLKDRATTVGENHGVGGAFGKRKGRLQWFEIGGYRFVNPIVGFALAKEGAMAGIFEVGNIGEKFLDPFTLIFDYPHRRIAFIAKKISPLLDSRAEPVL